MKVGKLLLVIDLFKTKFIVYSEWSYSRVQHYMKLCGKKMKSKGGKRGIFG